MINVTSSEWQGVEGMGEDMLREMKPKAERLMWDGGMKFQAALKKKLSGARSGKPYRVSGTGAICG